MNKKNPYDSPMAIGSIDSDQSITASVRVLQVITIALVMGVAVFAGYSLSKNKFALGFEPNSNCWIGIGFAGVAFLMSLVLPRVAIRAGLQKLDSKAVLAMKPNQQLKTLCPIKQSSNIISLSVLAGAGFFNVFLYLRKMFAGNIIVVAVVLVLMLSRFPSIRDIQNWVGDRLQELREMKG